MSALALPKRAKSRPTPHYLRLVVLADPETGEARRAFVAADHNEASALEGRKLKNGTVYRCTISDARNHKHHRLVMATLQFLVDSTDYFENIEQALTALKIGMGYVDPVIHVDEKQKVRTTYIVRSISFDAMGEDEFSKFHRDMVKHMTKRYLPDMDPNTWPRFEELTRGTPV